MHLCLVFPLVFQTILKSSYLQVSFQMREDSPEFVYSLVLFQVICEILLGATIAISNTDAIGTVYTSVRHIHHGSG
ncbi:hypothetical protein K435DRAFT_857635 [Dendrothele bispora CBS 962.96]|uniref:Uncharacterized protein n=1 Tax=Dendrothele bispora (strain CBS 962.96) TaxID=1314807 RepID=A0A4S8M5B0_DENBC|nr:hypothetical protein K435DRAFT_857635 [Dendrothele bispora CBS 962.96]